MRCYYCTSGAQGRVEDGPCAYCEWQAEQVAELDEVMPWWRTAENESEGF